VDIQCNHWQQFPKELAVSVIPERIKETKNYLCSSFQESQGLELKRNQKRFGLALPTVYIPYTDKVSNVNPFAMKF